MLQCHPTCLSWFINVSNFLRLHKDISKLPSRVRGHSKKLCMQKCNKSLRQKSFKTHWNSLPETIVSAPSINSFERRLDKFWISQEIRFNFRAQLELYHTNNSPYGTGSCSDMDEDFHQINFTQDDLLI